MYHVYVVGWPLLDGRSVFLTFHTFQTSTRAGVGCCGGRVGGILTWITCARHVHQAHEGSLGVGVLITLLASSVMAREHTSGVGWGGWGVGVLITLLASSVMAREHTSGVGWVGGWGEASWGTTSSYKREFLF